MKNLKIKFVSIIILILLGVYLTSITMNSISKGRMLTSLIYLTLLIPTAYYASKIMYEFRYLNKIVNARNEIKSELDKIKIGKKYTMLLSQSLATGNTELSEWKELPDNTKVAISATLTKLKTKRH